MAASQDSFTTNDQFLKSGFIAQSDYDPLFVESALHNQRTNAAQPVNKPLVIGDLMKQSEIQA